jgi:hypothetical protein
LATLTDEEIDAVKKKICNPNIAISKAELQHQQKVTTEWQTHFPKNVIIHIPQSTCVKAKQEIRPKGAKSIVELAKEYIQSPVYPLDDYNEQDYNKRQDCIERMATLIVSICNKCGYGKLTWNSYLTKTQMKEVLRRLGDWASARKPIVETPLYRFDKKISDK